MGRGHAIVLTRRSGSPADRWLPLLAILLIAATLRIAVASLSPLLDRIEGDLTLAPVVVGLIGAAPPLAFGVFGFLAPALARRLSLERLALLVAAVAGVGLVARAFAGEPIGLLVWTVVLFAAIGVGNVVVPGLVKKYFPDRIGQLTAAYISTMSVATIIPPLIAVPFADAAGWRLALGVWAVVAAAAIVPWLVLAVRARRAIDPDAVEEPSPRVLRRLLALPRTWGLVLGFVTTSATAYAMFAWLPLIVQEQADVSQQTAGVLLAVFAGMGLPFSLFVPVIVARWGRIRTLFVVAMVPGLAGVAGLLFAAPAAPFLWIVLVSLPTLLFPVVLTSIGLATRTHETTVALSGAVQSIGYGLAAVAPFAVGALHETTGGWGASLALFAVVIALGIPAMILVARPGTIEDDWEARSGRTW